MARRGAISAVFVALAALSGPASAAESIGAELRCPVEPSPGRVLCTLEVEARSGRLVWSDALVVQAPDFAQPLRARVGGREASPRGERRAELPVVFIAQKLGKGEVVVIARAVVCERAAGAERELCVSVSRRVRATLEVGVPEQAPR